MIVELQTEALEALEQPATYGPDAGPVERVDTHISAVFLVGSRAYKLKRAVRFDYLDFSTVEKRRAACEAEVALNRRTAPSLYLGVVPLARAADGRLRVGGEGPPIEWLVEMRRFDQNTLFDRLAVRGQLSERLLGELATSIAVFHAGAEPRDDHGGLAGMRWVIDGNRDDIAKHVGTTFAAAEVDALVAATGVEIDAVADLLDRRRRDGRVRRCHGDLHLRNICLDAGRPLVFDAIEFNDEISCVDVLYDLAFLLMDLLHRGLAGEANVVLNRYLERALDYEGLRLLPLFLSVRAAVRAKIGASTADVQEGVDVARSREEARAYLRLAARFLDRRPPTVVAIGGLSGSGKSTLAHDVAPFLGPAPGAVIVRSDVVRKTMWGLEDLGRALPPEAYRPEISARVYDEVCLTVARIVAAGHGALADAVFLDQAHRRLVEATAREAGVPFHGLWLDVPTEVMAARLRHRTGDVSDADVAVLAQQVRRGGAVDWRHVDGLGDRRAVARRALSVLSQR